MKKLRSSTSYFLSEGKVNLHECLRASFARATTAGVTTIVVFTLNGEGVEIACDEFLREERYKHIKLVAVSFPIGTVPPAASEISESRMELMKNFDIPLLRAASPIDDIRVPNARQDNLVRKTLELFSGGTALCVWAALVACDAGEVPPGEHVIACCADTAILAKAAPSINFLSSFVVREFVCKPLIMDVSKGESLAEEINTESLSKRRSKKLLASQPQLKDVNEERDGSLPETMRQLSDGGKSS